jgi:pyruvate dehydrogenase E2 component (dihydrolipoamide acetyltransferase)
MATRVDMPQLGLTMETGTILRWLVAEGEVVEKGKPVVLIQTDKVEYEVESPAAGTVLKIVGAEGAELPVGTLMAVLGQPGEDVSAIAGAAPAAAPAEAKPAAPSAERRAPEAQPAAPVRAPGERVKISPVAKKLAQEHGIDINTLAGTGPEGRIIREDVERAMAAGPGRAQAAPQPVAASIPLAGIRKVIFDRMGQSARETARVTLFADADVTELVRLRQGQAADWERRFGVKPSYTDLIHFAVARALREEPRINCCLDGQAVRVRAEVHLAFAVDLGEGLVAAVVKDADRKSLGELAKAARDLAERGRAGKLTPDEMADGTFTVSNLGAFGVGHFTPVINQPQAAILGIGAIQERPVVIGGGIHVRSILPLSLVFDHRLIDGAPAAKFLAKVNELLTHPAWIG